MKNSKGMIILLVALAALTLVVVVGLFFFYPKEQPVPAAAPVVATDPAVGTPLPDTFDPVEWTRDPKTNDLQAPSPTVASDQGFTVTLPAEPQGSASPQPLPPSPGASFPSDVASEAPNVQSTPVAPPKAPVAVKPAKPAPQLVKVTEYWIQVGSFRDRYQAENTAKALEAQGLKGTLSTATVNGLAVVRVRVGPYANEAEAGKFLAWLQPVKEFGGSYVTRTSVSRAAP